MSVRFLARLYQGDNRTVLGQTIRSLLDQCGLNMTTVEKLTAALIKRSCSYFRTPEAELWRIPLIQELLEVKEGKLVVGELAIEEVNQMIVNLCVH